MSIIKDVIGVLSGLILLYAFYPYLSKTIRGEMGTGPRSATWFVWALGDTIACAGQIAKHATSWLLVGAVIGATATFIVSLIYGEKGWKTREKVCVSISMLAIVLWIYFGESNYGIFFSLLSLVIAAWPTWESAWANPANEDKKSWIIFTISSFLAVLAIPNSQFAAWAPAIVFLTIDSVTLAIVMSRGNALRRI